MAGTDIHETLAILRLFIFFLRQKFNLQPTKYLHTQVSIIGFFFFTIKKTIMMCDRVSRETNDFCENYNSVTLYNTTIIFGKHG